MRKNAEDDYVDLRSGRMIGRRIVLDVIECPLTYILSGHLKSSVELLPLPGIGTDVDHY